MNSNSFEQIQSLLSQISNYVSKINEIIFQINNIINSQNQMNLMNQMMQINMMNNMMNFGNNINTNLNPLLNNQGQEQFKANLINVVFEYNSKKINIIAEEYLPINEVINRFLTKIDRPKLINNYTNKLGFLFNGYELDYSKKVNEINSKDPHFNIVVFDRNQIEKLNIDFCS